MKCEECEHRFICHTSRVRPLQINGINYAIGPYTCSDCKHTPFSRYNYGSYMYTKVAICRFTRLLTHYRAWCPSFEYKKTSTSPANEQKMKNEVEQTLKEKRGKLPRYCIKNV